MWFLGAVEVSDAQITALLGFLVSGIIGLWAIDKKRTAQYPELILKAAGTVADQNRIMSELVSAMEDRNRIVEQLSARVAELSKLSEDLRREVESLRAELKAVRP